MRVILRAGFLALATSLIVAGTAAAQAQQGTAAPAKIAYINSAQLLREAPGRAEAEAQFDREVGVYRQQIQRMDETSTLHLPPQPIDNVAGELRIGCRRQLLGQDRQWAEFRLARSFRL